MRTRILTPQEALGVVPQLDASRFLAASWNPDDAVVNSASLFEHDTAASPLALILSSARSARPSKDERVLITTVGATSMMFICASFAPGLMPAPHATNMPCISGCAGSWPCAPLTVSLFADTSAAPTPWPRTCGSDAIQYRSNVPCVIGVGPKHT